MQQFQNINQDLQKQFGIKNVFQKVYKGEREDSI